jgi:hypothetical protein
MKTARYQVMNIQVGHVLYQSNFQPDAENMCMRWKIQLAPFASLICVVDDTTGEIVYGLEN